MPRKLRIEYPGAIYHVMSRANGKGDIFLNDVDRQIAERPHLGSWKSLNNKLHLRSRSKGKRNRA